MDDFIRINRGCIRGMNTESEQLLFFDFLVLTKLSDVFGIERLQLQKIQGGNQIV